MKKACISFLIVGIIILSGIGLLTSEDKNHKEYLRIHIRANSNLEIDQTIKYQIKDKIVDYLTPYIAQCKSKQSAEQMLKENLDNIENLSDSELQKQGYKYSSKASIKNEKFPTRIYDGYTLESGFYDALIIELGSGEGDNWWCVVYPPLCFSGQGGNYIYRSKILDIISDFYFKEKR